MKFLIKLFYSMNNRGLFFWMSDYMNVKLKYHLRMGRHLDLENPITFNEKLQWLKVHDHNPKYTALVDKIEAKKHIKDIIGDDHIVPIYKIWNRAEDINCDDLPNQFVLKCNHDQGSVMVVDDKTSLNMEEVKKFYGKRLKLNNYWNTREYPYKNITPKVFAEEYLGGEIRDYKFYCFDGEPKFLYVGQGLTIDHSLKIDYFDMNWQPMPFYRTDYNRLGFVSQPAHFKEMKEMAAKLSQGIPFVRIDLFEENGKVYFSEFTLYPASGFMPFEPQNYDFEIGKWIIMQEK